MELSRCDLAGFDGIAAEWDRLAVGGDSPFLTSAWQASWWRAFATKDGIALLLRAEDGALLAGGCFLEGGRGTLRAATNAHSNDWGVVARDLEARQRFWVEVAALEHRSLALEPVPAEDDQVSAPQAALAGAGRRVLEEGLEPSPWMELPASLEELLAGRSRNLRSQVGRRRRKLEGEGDLRLRVVRGGATLEADLDAFFALEAAGWKGEEGTAIAADPALVDLYRRFAEAAAAGGWLRLYLLELNQSLVAADYGCVFDGCGYLIKTAFDEDLGRFAPGLVLRAAVLESSIEEGLARYDFLGGPDEYKLRWTDQLRKRAALYAWGGRGAALPYVWRSRVRPRLKQARDLGRDRIPGRGRSR
jgi:CelD/BcsL family acetyltransferase involved in cellulose biosynthesis